jgi:hypothetical protein
MRVRIVVPIAAVCAAGAVFGAGALASGQPPSGASASQDAGSLAKRALFAVLTGRKEVDANGSRGAGDPDGRGSFTATIDGNELCFGITVKNLDAPGAAHIHKGRAHQNGGIVVPLVHPQEGDPGASAGCVPIADELAQAILEHPRRYYANVHTTAFGAGAIRGQLFRRSR